MPPIIATRSNPNQMNPQSNSNSSSFGISRSSILPPEPFTVNSVVEYDFESYALEHGIPETLDPLPYRKTPGIVFAGEKEYHSYNNNDPINNNNNNNSTTGNKEEPQTAGVLTSAKYDPRLRTVVCRHWLRDLCMKGAACEFLHVFDLSKMPLCRWGERCKVIDCPFRHVSESSRLPCVFYGQGFCIHGPFCKYRHERRPRSDVPIVADFTLGLSQMQSNHHKNSDRDRGGGDVFCPEAGSQPTLPQQRRPPSSKPNEFFKISLCKHFLAGHCPFGDSCHFAHGEEELRPYPRMKEEYNPEEYSNPTGNNDEAPLGEENQNRHHHNNNSNNNNTLDYFQGGGGVGGGMGSGDGGIGGKPMPTMLQDQRGASSSAVATAIGYYFFIVLAARQEDLAVSTVEGEWWLQPRDAHAINGRLLNNHQVILFFTAAESLHLQGAALVVAPATYEQPMDFGRKDDNDNTSTNNDEPFCFRISLEWYRTVELPIATVHKAIPDLVMPTDSSSSSLSMTICQEQSTRVGEALLKIMWDSPLVTLYECWMDYGDDGTNNNNDNDHTAEPPAEDAILIDFRCPARDEIAWPTRPGSGFIFGCSSDTMDECLGRGIFGLPAHMESAASCIVPNSTLFLFNVTDRLLFGIFEALTPAVMDIVPNAFSRSKEAAAASPFPIQVRVRVALECPPVEDTDPVLNRILRSRPGGRIGSLTHAQTSAIASMMSYQCGALQYMLEYQRGVEQGARVRAPPIALPPKKMGVAAQP